MYCDCCWILLLFIYIVFSTLVCLGMKVKPYKEEVIELVLQFLQKQLGQVQIVKKLREKHMENLPQWVLKNNKLINKGLTKIIKSFVQMEKNIKQYYALRKPQPQQQREQQIQQQIQQQQKKPQQKNKRQRKKSANQQIEQKQKPQKKNTKIQAPKVETHHENTSTWVINKFQPPKKLQQIGKDYDKNKPIVSVKKPSMVAKQASSQESSDRPMHSDHSDSQQEKKKSKNIKSKKPIKKQTSEQQSDQSPQVKKPAIKQKNITKKQKKQQKLQQKNQQKAAQKIQKKVEEKVHKMHTRLDDAKQHQQELQQEKPLRNGTKTNSYSSFSRIKPQQIGPIPQKLRDNSFEAKFKYGKGGDQWGRYGHQKLKDTRGDSFKKTKDKLKNKAFQGANIDFNVINSIPLQ